MILLFLLGHSTNAQFDHETIFPELHGEELYNALVANYKTSSVLTYGEARDTFMRNIDAVDNLLTCVYTGYTISLNPNLDPTTDAFAQAFCQEIETC